MKGKISLPDGTGGEIEASPEDLNALQKFFSVITPEFIHDSIGILNDNIKFKRWKNIVKITQEAEKIRQKHNLKSIPLPLKTSIGYIEAASLEEDETLQELWANLLANTTAETSSTNGIYVSILKELTTVEARVLNILYTNMNRMKKERELKFSSTRKELLIKEIRKHNSDWELILDNLMRLRLIKLADKSPSRLPMSLGLGSLTTLSSSTDLLNTTQDKNAKKILEYLRTEERNTEIAENTFQLTSLGASLIKACSEPDTPGA